MKNITDKNLYELCQQYGKNARIWKRKFVALLPEVYKRRLYKKKGFGSIFEFAAKWGGVSKNVVREVIRIDEKLKDMPKLKEKIAEIGIHKIRIVASIATKETDEQWAKKATTMTKSALETHVRDIRKSHPGMSLPVTPQSPLFCNGQEVVTVKEKTTNTKNSLFHNEQGTTVVKEESANIENSFYNNDHETFSIKLNPEIIQKLKHLKANMKDGTCWNDVFEKLISQTKIKKSRARNLKSKAKQICEVPGCNKPATIIHHPDRFGLTKTHKNLASLCKSHHELAHRGYLDEQNNFKTLVQPILNSLKQPIDQKMLQYLRGT